MLLCTIAVHYYALCTIKGSFSHYSGTLDQRGDYKQVIWKEVLSIYVILRDQGTEVQSKMLVSKISSRSELLTAAMTL